MSESESIEGKGSSAHKPVGVWLIGARGSISIVTVAGHAAIGQKLCGPHALVTERPQFAAAGLAPLGSMVFGGHEIRKGNVPNMAKQLLDGCGVPYIADHVRPALEAYEANIRPGVVRGAGEQIEQMAEDTVAAASDGEAIRAIRADLDAFKADHGLDRLVVVNLASTEPSAEPHPSWESLGALEAAVGNGSSVLSASSIYAFATLQGGDAFINFTPSIGSRIPALNELALERGALHAGSDGKTGETLAKSILGELFARRNLEVLSWFGQNILGNEDGRILNNPQNKATKILSKDHLLTKILGYAPDTHVGIDYVPSLGEWKIAWDHIHFRGFLGGQMHMQFVWNGCDSLLAAPLIIDLVRLSNLAQQRRQKGVLSALAAFFKDPMNTTEQRLITQDTALIDWVRNGG